VVALQNDPAKSRSSQQGRQVQVLLRLQTNGSKDEDGRGQDLPPLTLRSLHADPPEIAEDALLRLSLRYALYWPPILGDIHVNCT